MGAQRDKIAKRAAHWPQRERQVGRAQVARNCFSAKRADVSEPGALARTAPQAILLAIGEASGSAAIGVDARETFAIR